MRKLRDCLTDDNGKVLVGAYLTEIGLLAKVYHDDKIISKETYQCAANIVKAFPGCQMKLSIGEFGDTVAIYVIKFNIRYWIVEGAVIGSPEFYERSGEKSP